ncbi:MAG: HAD family acid phosphatase [Paracoccaceae bacterium]|nr:MAG: hypothetical protein DBW70_06310 [Alphaproteobacteria bacterium]
MERNVRFAEHAFPREKNLLKRKNHSAGIRFIDIIFDIDGTILDISHRVKFALQNPKDWKSFYSNMDADQPIEEICTLLKSLIKDDTNQILFCTGRVEDYRKKTIEQINKILKGCKYFDIDSFLYMRPKGDLRKDFMVKRDLYNKMINDGFDPVLVFEDKATVVEMWQELGLKCLKVTGA